MKKSIRHPKGFTLVEVALAVAVGLIIIGGAMLGYGAVKENAANTSARSRVMQASALVEEYSSGNYGSYPDVNTFRRIWSTRRPDDYNSSPWNGPVGTAAASGVVAADLSGFAPGLSRDLATTLPDVPQDGTNAAALHFGRLGNNGWAKRVTSSSNAERVVHGYFVSIFDKNGVAYFEVAGSR